MGALMLHASGCGYESIRELEDRARLAHAGLRAELVRRNELVPDIVAIVDEAAAFEQRRPPAVLEARAAVGRARQDVARALEAEADAAAIGRAGRRLGQSMRRFLDLAVEAYPTLNANPNFSGLVNELEASRNRIIAERRAYNQAVRAYNSEVRRLPNLLTAMAMGAGRQDTLDLPLEPDSVADAGVRR